MQSREQRWQNRMAPLMASAVVFTAVFFAVVMLTRFSAIEQALQEPPPSQIAIPWTKVGLEPNSWRDQVELARVEADFALEREIIARRYRQASSTLSLRLWTRFMGFLTGMILSMVGAAFVLGKLSAPESEITGSANAVSLSIKSASPGIILTVLGAILMGVTLITPVTTDVHDGAVYFGRSDTDTDTALPLPLDAMNPANDADSPPKPAQQKVSQ